MNKRLSLILFLLIIMLASCNMQDDKYYLDIDDPNNFIIEDLNKKYQEGEKVTVKTNIIYDADLYLYIDDEFVCSQTPVETSGEFTHWEFSFTMPKNDARISFKTIKETEEIKYAPETEKLIFFDNQVSEILYEIKFNYEISKETKNLHQEFFENSGLKDLDYKNVFYFENSPNIFLYFTPENDTAVVKEFMDKLKDDNESIIMITRTLHYLYQTVYIHNPLFYELEANQKILFELTNPVFLPVGIYKTVADVQAGLAAAFEFNKDETYLLERKDKITEEINSKYNQAYFENNILVITDTIITGSGSNRQKLHSIYLKDNKLYLFVKMYFPITGTCDMQSSTFAIKIAKNSFSNLDALEQVLLYKNPSLDGHGLW